MFRKNKIKLEIYNNEIKIVLNALNEFRNKLIKEYVASQGNYSFKAYIDNNPNALDSISTIVGTSKITTNTSARYVGIALLAYADTNRGITTYSLVIIYQ